MTQDSDKEQPSQATEQYWKNVDTFISAANKMSTDQGIDNTSSTLLYAAARFSAFNAASKYKEAEALSLDKEEAIKYFTATFTKMFQQNMDDYEKNFDQYFKSQAEDK